MDYKEKLRAWNSTEKYKSEMLFLNKLLPNPKYALEYGSGRGMCAYIIGADGYDVNDYNECLKPYEYYTQLPDNDYTDVYFMHVFAHLPNPKDVLRILKSKYPKATITVITPNDNWIKLQNNPNYKPDLTVYKHYSMTELKQLFEDCGYKVELIGQFGEVMNGVNERIFLQAYAI